jgi:hypothetical protein
VRGPDDGGDLFDFHHREILNRHAFPLVSEGKGRHGDAPIFSLASAQ